MIRQKGKPDQPPPQLHPLQQRRDVAGLCVMFKVHVQHSTYRFAPTAVDITTRLRKSHRRRQSLTDGCSLRQDRDLLAILPSKIRKDVEPLGAADAATPGHINSNFQSLSK